MMRNVTELEFCYGCGVCTAACPYALLDLWPDRDGFYKPYSIDPERCSGCGRCLRSCAFLDRTPPDSKPLSCRSVRHSDPTLRMLSSSGGAAPALAAALFAAGYAVCGVRYDAATRSAVHTVTHDFAEYASCIGSKYLQSYTRSAFSVLRDRTSRVALFGTPCQIGSLRRLVRMQQMEERTLLVDLFCHGVPSSLLWEGYVRHMERTGEPLRRVAWRSKCSEAADPARTLARGEHPVQTADWHDSYRMTLVGPRTVRSGREAGSRLFYDLFLGDYCLGRACYETCPYKGFASAADIRLGDLWGAAGSGDREGASSLTVFTDRGSWLASRLEGCEQRRLSPGEVLSGQQRHRGSAPRLSGLVMSALRLGVPLVAIHRTLVLPDLMLRRVVSRAVRSAGRLGRIWSGLLR